MALSPKSFVQATAALGLGAALTLGTAQATDLRIYPSFSEVREVIEAPERRLTVRLPQAAWEGVIPGSLSLEGVAFTEAVARLEGNWLSTLEGQTVYLRRGEQTEPVTLIRARDLLVKNAAGRYFQVRYEDLEFPQEPPASAQTPVQTLTYALLAPGRGTLSYLTRSVTWTPRYTLRASDAGAQLAALADIRNTADLPYEVSAAELYAGEVQVQGTPTPRADFALSAEASPARTAPAAPQIQAAGDLRGLAKYTLSQAFTLPPSSTVTLPFLTPKLSRFERFGGLQTYFSPQVEREGNLERGYRFEAEERLPEGPLLVREDGRIVGQAQVPATRPGGKVEFSLGEDPDLTYTRRVERLKEQKDAKGQVVQTTYRVTYSLVSAKSRPVRAEITERVSGRRVVFNSLPPAPNQGSFTLKLDVPAKGRAQGSFTLLIDNS